MNVQENNKPWTTTECRHHTFPNPSEFFCLKSHWELSVVVFFDFSLLRSPRASSARKSGAWCCAASLANWWQTQPKNRNNHRNDSKTCKTKLALSEVWAELSPPRRKERWRRNDAALGGGSRGKNPRQGESLDKDRNRQNNYEQTKSTRHAGRPVDLHNHKRSMYGEYWWPQSRIPT